MKKLLICYLFLGYIAQSEGLAQQTAPKILSQPEDLAVAEGEDATFSAQAEGSDPLSYQWQFNGVDVAGATGNTFTRFAVRTNDAGKYSVRVNNHLGQILSTNATLIIFSPPMILAQPESLVVMQGSTASFSVNAIGVPPPDYQWRFNGFNLADEGGISGATSSALTINGVSSSHEGDYSVVIANIHGASTSVVAHLTVVAPPPVNHPPVLPFQDDRTISQSDMLLVTNTAVDADLPPQVLDYTLLLAPPGAMIDSSGVIQWAPASAGYAGTQTFSTEGATSDPNEPSHCGYPPCASYWLSYVAPADGWLAIDTRGTTFNAVLAVYAGPGTDYAALVPVACSANHGSVGESVTFQAAAGTTYWIVIEGVGCATGLATINYALWPEPKSWVFTTLVTDNGQPPLSATNEFTVLVNPSPTAPQIVSQPASQNLRVGDPASVSVAAIGTPPLSYQWYLNGQVLSNATSATLAFPAIGVVHDGTYQVAVSNEVGSVLSEPATFAVYTAPAILQSPASLQVTLGAPATFKVTATSSRPLSYQWFFEGSPISGATGPAYSINSAQLGNAGNYSVTASNFGGVAASPAAALVVLPFASPAPLLSSYLADLRPGLNLIANQLNRGGNTLNEVLPVVPDGSVVAKYNNGLGTWQLSTYVAALGAWSPAGITLAPGEGAFLDTPIDFKLTFTGTPNVPILPVLIPEGAAFLLSRQTNAPGTYEDIVGASPSPGAVVYKWNNSNSTYTAFAPTAEVGEALWIGPNGGGPAEIPTVPAITVQPVSVTTTQGGMATFSVTATGTEPLNYQWRLNGNVIPGATSEVLKISNVQPADAGIYSATVNNAVGSVDSDTAQLTISDLPVLPFANNFSAAGPIGLGGTTSGLGTGFSVGATLEQGEPTPNFIPAGASVWLQWQPVASGRATITTAGSGFDTVLGVYTGVDVKSLAQIAADDDGAPSHCSLVRFNITAGNTYYIQVAGFHGAAGNIVLSWVLDVAPALPPVIVTQPHDQTVPEGLPATLSVTVEAGSPVAYQWYFEGHPLLGYTSSTLNIPAMTGGNVGTYYVAVTNTETFAGVVSLSARLQMIVAGVGQQGDPANVSAQDKFLTATDLTPPDPNIPRDPPPASGYTGTQTFSTVGATADPSEPNHCGYPACGTYWCSYLAPASGLLTIDTKGTTFNAILAVYTGPGTSFTSLVPVACSANHGAAGESVTFQATAGTTYWIVVEGMNCAAGLATINYTLSATPAFTTLPVSQTVTNGARVTLSSAATGAPPLSYQWRFNGVDINGATTNSYQVPAFRSTNEGIYTLVMNNGQGSTESPATYVYLNNPPRLVDPGIVNGYFMLQLAAQANVNYVMETSSDLVTWHPLRTNSSPLGFITIADPVNADNKYYRARKP